MRNRLKATRIGTPKNRPAAFCDKFDGNARTKERKRITTYSAEHSVIIRTLNPGTETITSFTAGEKPKIPNIHATAPAVCRFKGRVSVLDGSQLTRPKKTKLKKTKPTANRIVPRFGTNTLLSIDLIACHSTKDVRGRKADGRLFSLRSNDICQVGGDL